ncbi:MAG: hypothetical protein FE78DRAFT_488169 [Acidomyces sp. 'richmondensis']|nr:MAG: hypothetical protein FE78DRAFT_488169 [Acidomyces sp. 'richmondensis']
MLSCLTLSLLMGPAQLQHRENASKSFKLIVRKKTHVVSSANEEQSRFPTSKSLDNMPPNMKTRNKKKDYPLAKF